MSFSLQAVIGLQNAQETQEFVAATRNLDRKRRENMHLFKLHVEACELTRIPKGDLGCNG